MVLVSAVTGKARDEPPAHAAVVARKCRREIETAMAGNIAMALKNPRKQWEESHRILMAEKLGTKAAEMVTHRGLPAQYV